MDQTKMCSVCRIEKPFNEYHKDRTKKYGISYECKSCKKIRDKEYSKKYREEINEKSKKYREEHRKELNEKNKKYREEHREEINEKNRKYREEHREVYGEIKNA